MSQRYELKTLKQTVKLLDCGDRQPMRSTIFRISLLALGVITIAGSLVLVSRGIVPGAWGVVIAAFGGVFAGVGSYFGVAMKQWPIIKPHIDRGSIERRLNEIET